jgi:hypothetical protein
MVGGGLSIDGMSFRTFNVTLVIRHFELASTPYCKSNGKMTRPLHTSFSLQ